MTDIAPDAGAGAPAEGGAEAPSGFDGIDYDALEVESSKWTPEQSKEQISRLRGEHQKYREKFGPVQKAISGFDTQTQTVLLEAIQAIGPQKPGESDGAYKDRIVAASKWWTGSAKNLAGDAWKDIYAEFSPAEQAAVDKAAETAAPGEIPQPGTPEFVKWMQEQIDGGVQKKLDGFTSTQQQERAQNEALVQVRSELTELGYDPDSPDAELICFLAQQNHDGDLAAAHEAWTERQADIARNYIKSKQKAKPAPSAGAAGRSTDGERVKSGAEKMAERWDSGYFNDVPAT